MQTQISRFTERCVWLAKRVADETDEPAAPEGGGGFADYAMIPLHCLRMYLDTSYRMTIDLLTEMPRICREIGLEPADLPHYSTLCLAFERLEMKVCRVLLCYSAQLHDTGDIAAIDAAYFDRSRASRHYSRRTNYRVQTLEATNYDYAHNARIDDDLYGQRSMAETVFSSGKRSLGCALRARTWYREFREVALMCAVHNIKKAAKQGIPLPSYD